jgi:hypothetical protein
MHNTINPFSSQSPTSEVPVKDKTAFGSVSSYSSSYVSFQDNKSDTSAQWSHKLAGVAGLARASIIGMHRQEHRRPLLPTLTQTMSEHSPVGALGDN